MEQVVATLLEIDWKAPCLAGVKYSAGDEFIFENGERVQAMCGPLFHLLLPHVLRILVGENGRMQTIVCPLTRNVMVFEFSLASQ